ncbi:hypothetical protein ABZ208_11345 [Streptomyces sp. NPDC006208]|uniref:hypothetical protein n=1 Tax=Streptomyces sp. NPDC006208 TaxID=3156734 RepID=UPI0033B968A2
MLGIRKLSGVAAAGMAAVALAATPAAAKAPYWQPVKTNSSWSCSDYTYHQMSYNVNFKACVVSNDPGYKQGVLVVQNNAKVKIDIRGRVYTEGGLVDQSLACMHSPLSAGATTGCFLPSTKASGVFRVKGALWMNGDENENLDIVSWHD